jgi:hypothetical protein
VLQRSIQKVPSDILDSSASLPKLRRVVQRRQISQPDTHTADPGCIVKGICCARHLVVLIVIRRQEKLRGSAECEVVEVRLEIYHIAFGRCVSQSRYQVLDVGHQVLRTVVSSALVSASTYYLHA